MQIFESRGAHRGLAFRDAIPGAKNLVGRMDEPPQTEDALASKLHAFLENLDEQPVTFERRRSALHAVEKTRNGAELERLALLQAADLALGKAHLGKTVAQFSESFDALVMEAPIGVRQDVHERAHDSRDLDVGELDERQRERAADIDVLFLVAQTLRQVVEAVDAEARNRLSRCGAQRTPLQRRDQEREAGRVPEPSDTERRRTSDVDFRVLQKPRQTKHALGISAKKTGGPSGETPIRGVFAITALYDE